MIFLGAVTSTYKHQCDLLPTVLIDENVKLQLEESAKLSSRGPSSCLWIQ